MSAWSISFDEWWGELKSLATKAEWPLDNDKDAFKEYYDDGDSPEDTLATEMSYAEDDGEDF